VLVLSQVRRLGLFTVASLLLGSCVLFPGVPHRVGFIDYFVTQAVPLGIAEGDDGDIWFANSGNQNLVAYVGHVSANGRITLIPVPGGGAPQRITRGPDGNYWFTDIQVFKLYNRIDKIGRISPSGVSIEFPIPTRNAAPAGLTSGPDGAIWFAENYGDKIGRITTQGKISEYPLPGQKERPNKFNGPYGIVAGKDGNIWFTLEFPNSIGRITGDGKVTEFRIPTPDADPTGITEGSDGNLWFTETDGDKIGRITMQGRITEFAVPKGTKPSEICSGPDGSLWFTERGTDAIGRMDSHRNVTQAATLPSGPWSGSGGIVTTKKGDIWFAVPEVSAKLIFGDMLLGAIGRFRTRDWVGSR
jgi:virginiamycin B lyase